MPQFIYTMKGLGRIYPPDHQVLKDIWLSFLPGAKIGVLGLNGAGKSSLLKVMAGEDQQFVGEAWPAAGISVGFLHQEPRLDANKNVLGNVEDGVAVTHDRYFLDNVAGWILELDRGHGIPWEGNYSSWLAQKQNRLAQEEKTESKRQRTLERELEWIRMSPRARQAKGKARLNAYEDLLREDTAQKIETAEIYIAPGPRLGDMVVEARNVRKGYDDNLLMDNLDFTLPRGGIVGVIGPNGAGKTTLFRMITGQEKPDAGTLKIGETVQIGYVDQSRESLSPNKSVFEEITGGNDEIELGKKKVASRAYVSWFNFKGAGQQRKVGTLSGGERNRVHLAKLLKRGSNLLLLDEPTNDLDVDTLRSLEEALLNFGGCAVVISHDRWFLDRIATHMLAFEGDSEVVWFEGNYQDYEADRKRRLGAAADQPHRIKYRKLTR